MARITVEDCLDKVDNRFELVMIASKRARQLQIEGKDPLLPVDNDKPTVIALREVADGLVTQEILVEKPSLELEEQFQSEPLEAAGENDVEAEAAGEEAAATTEEAEASDSNSDEAEEPQPAADE